MVVASNSSAKPFTSFVSGPLLFNSAQYFLHGSLILFAAEDVNVSVYVLICLSISACLSMCLPVDKNFPVLRCSLILSCFLLYLLVIICEYVCMLKFLQEHGFLSFVSVMCCQVENSVGLTLYQRESYQVWCA